MNRSSPEIWSTWRSLAFLAAIFAVVLGSLIPFAAMAASVPGQPIVICSVEGPKIIQSGGPTEQAPDADLHGAKCPACVMPMLAALPVPPAPEPAPVSRSFEAVTYSALIASPPPPARAPPRPPSTAPTHA